MRTRIRLLMALSMALAASPAWSDGESVPTTVEGGAHKIKEGGKEVGEGFKGIGRGLRDVFTGESSKENFRDSKKIGTGFAEVGKGIGGVGRGAGREVRAGFKGESAPSGAAPADGKITEETLPE
jgi:hypothetical protein